MKEMGKRCSDNFLSMVNDAVHPTQHHSLDPPKKEKKKKAAALMLVFSPKKHNCADATTRPSPLTAAH